MSKQPKTVTVVSAADPAPDLTIVPPVSQVDVPASTNPADLFRATFVALATGDEVLTDPRTTADLLVNYRGLPEDKRGRAVAMALGAAAKAGADEDRAADLSDMLTAKPAKAGKVAVDPSVILGDRFAALLVAGTSMPKPDGIDLTTVLARIGALVGPDAADLFSQAVGKVDTSKVADDLRITLNKSADRAVQAVSRGGSTNRKPAVQRRANTTKGAVKRHVDAVMAAQKVGTVLSGGTIAATASPDYPSADTDKDARPSTGSVANVLRKLVDGKATPLSGTGWVGIIDPNTGAKRV